MSELRREYQAIVDRLRANETYSFVDVALECQNLADSKEPVLLTDEEIIKLREDYLYPNKTTTDFARDIEAACHAKQRAPVTRDVTVRIYQDENGVIQSRADYMVCQTNWKLLDEFTRTVELK